MAKIRVSKIDAARRQIDVAIRLLFSQGDAVAIHTLAAAGGRILKDLCEQKATPSHIAFSDMIRPGKEAEFNALMNRASNFFKHADRDADEILDGVEEEVNDAVLMIATVAYADLGYTPSPEMTALHYWYVALHPNVLSVSATDELRANLEEIRSLSGRSRSQHLQAGKQLLAVIYRQRASVP